MSLLRCQVNFFLQNELIAAFSGIFLNENDNLPNENKLFQPNGAILVRVLLSRYFPRRGLGGRETIE